MNSLQLTRNLSLLAMVLTMLATPACKSTSSTAGTKVKQPFSGGKYESDNRWFRGTGQGVSIKQNIARSKADAPEVDAVVYLENGSHLKAGDIIRAEITGADDYDLYATPA